MALFVADVVIRILLAFTMSMLFGLERQFKKKPVGFGAFTFVTVGSTVLAIVAVDIVPQNPLPLLGAVMTGIGFLGAGAILKGTGDKKVTGITTAAAIWAFAAIGIAVGVGAYGLAILFYLLVTIIVVMDHYFEVHGFGSHSRHVTITLKDTRKIAEVDSLLPRKHKVLTYTLDTSKDEYTFTVLLSGTKARVNSSLNQLAKHKAVRKIAAE